MLRWIALFVLVPVVELALLIEIGRWIGTVPTLALIVVTGILGATLARRQGLGALRRMQTELAEGRLPTGPILDGACILFAGAVLLTPGILTDVVGFSLLVPRLRGWLRRVLRRRLERAVREGRVQVYTRMHGFERTADDHPVPPGSRVIDVEPKRGENDEST